MCYFYFVLNRTNHLVWNVFDQNVCTWKKRISAVTFCFFVFFIYVLYTHFEIASVPPSYC